MASIADMFARGQQMQLQREASEFRRATGEMQLDKMMRDRAMANQRTTAGYAEAYARAVAPETKPSELGGLLARLHPDDFENVVRHRASNVFQKLQDDQEMISAADQAAAARIAGVPFEQGSEPQSPMLRSLFGSALGARAAAERTDTQQAGAEERARLREQGADERARMREAGMEDRLTKKIATAANKPKKPLTPAQEKAVKDQIRDGILKEALGISAAEFTAISRKTGQPLVELPEELKGISREEYTTRLEKAVADGMEYYRGGMPIEDVAIEMADDLRYNKAKGGFLGFGDESASFAPKKDRSSTGGSSATRARQMVKDAVAQGQPIKGLAILKATGISREELQAIIDEENK